MELKMWHSGSMLCFSLLLCGLLGECFGLALVPKEKRGWTLNSAGYLLGPHAHQTLTEKGGLAAAAPARPAQDSTLQSLLDFLSFLHLREQGAVSRLPLSLVEEPVQQ